MGVPGGFPTVWLLALVNAIALSAFPMMMLIGSIIGARLAGSEQWATLPIALIVIGTACGVVPVVSLTVLPVSTKSTNPCPNCRADEKAADGLETGNSALRGGAREPSCVNGPAR